MTDGPDTPLSDHSGGGGSLAGQPDGVGFREAEKVLPQRDLDIARIAVESGMASEADVRTCVEEATRAAAAGSEVSLESLLVEREVLTVLQVRALLGVRWARRERSTKLGKYEIVEKIAEGAMGAVYKARGKDSDTIVALKILSSGLSSDSVFVARFLREARVAAELEHPNIVHCLDVGTLEDRQYLVMEYIDGPSLEDLIQEHGPLPVGEALGIALQGARALEYAWENKLVHRDIKPDNILLTSDGVAKLTDLGLVKSLGDVKETKLTQDNTAMGTPHYIAPEQAKGDPVDIRADLYSLGVTLYRMVTNEFPFEGTDSVSIIMDRFHRLPPRADVTNPDVSESFADVIDTMLAFEQKDRYPDPQVLLGDLELLAQGQAPTFGTGKKAASVRAAHHAHTITGEDTVVMAKPPRKLNPLRVAIPVGAFLLLYGLLYFALVPREKFEDLPAEVLLAKAKTQKQIEAAREKAQTELVEERKRAREEEGLKREKLTAVAAEEYEEILSLVEDGRYQQALERIGSLPDNYAQTDYLAKFQVLKMECAGKIEDQARLGEEKRERERRYNEAMDEARRQMSLGDYAVAINFLTQARSLNASEEVEELLASAQRARHTARAALEEEAGNLQKAVNFYTKALQISDDAELRAHVVELERKWKLASQLSACRQLAAEGKLREASAGYVEALDIAAEDEKAGINEAISQLEREILYAQETAQAEAAEQAEEWEEALAHAEAALAAKPGDAHAESIAERARDALGPEPEITNSIGMQFVLVPAGGFIMGSDEGDPDERPAREVFLDDYYIGRFEVTNEQFEMFSPAHREKWKSYSPGGEMPVIAVSYNDTVAFCRWLSRKEGIEHRLPTEAEWEEAARGRDGREYPWGDETPDGLESFRCNFAPGRGKEAWKRDGFEFCAPVASFPEGASPFGCHDMVGNVWEWCADWYDVGYYWRAPTENPSGPPEGEKRVVRGGSFTNPGRVLRCANRLGKSPDDYDANLGFRIVREVKKKKE